MKKRIILPTILLTGALAIGTLGLTRAYAQESANYPPIVEKIAEHFGLKQEEVMDVFEEVQADRHAKMLANFEDNLDQAVAAGKITGEQKQKLLDKHEEMQATMGEWRDLPFEERKEKMKSYHDELQQWAQDSGINLPFFGLGAGLGKGFRMEYHMSKLAD